jgi:4-amino-4-deoxychorismate lyase
MAALATRIDGRPGALVPVDDRGLQYGDGLFETVAVRHGALPLWQRHLARLLEGCARLGWTRVPSVEELEDDARALAADVEQGVIKVMVTRGSGGRGYRAPADTMPRRIVSLWPWPEGIEHGAQEGVTACWCRTRVARHPQLAGLKHLHRLEQVLARAEWQDEYAEGLMCDEQDRVIEGTMSNVFVRIDGQLRTPELNEAGVAGVMRAAVLECAHELNIACQETTVCRDSFAQAEEIFLTNSIIGIWPIRTLAGRNYPIGETTRVLAGALESKDCVAYRI